MKNLYYAYSPNASVDISSIDINEFIQPCTPSSSEWFSSLDFFLDGYKSINDRFSDMKRKMVQGVMPPTELQGDHVWTTIKNCPGIKDLFKTTYLIKAPCDIHISILRDNNSDQLHVIPNYASEGLVSVTSMEDSAYKSRTSKVLKDTIAVRFTLPILLKSQEDYVTMDPQYHETNPPWRVTNGVMSSGYQGPLQVNTFFPNQEGDYLIKKDTVLAYYYFHKKVKLKLDDSLTKPVFFTRFIGKY